MTICVQAVEKTMLIQVLILAALLVVGYAAVGGVNGNSLVDVNKHDRLRPFKTKSKNAGGGGGGGSSNCKDSWTLIG